MNWTWFHRLGSPPHVYGFATRWTPWFGGAAAIAIVVALFGGLVLAPEDYQQKDAFRMVYVHAPSAWLSLMAYSTMAVAAAVGLIWRMKVAHSVAAACAPIGAALVSRRWTRRFSSVGWFASAISNWPGLVRWMWPASKPAPTPIATRPALFRYFTAMSLWRAP